MERNAVLIPQGIATIGIHASEKPLLESFVEPEFRENIYSHMVGDYGCYTQNVEAFWLDKYPVTRAQFRQFYEWLRSRKGWENGDIEHFEGVFARELDEEVPMTDLTWHQASLFCRWRGGRLPSNAEWERACRGSSPIGLAWATRTEAAARCNWRGMDDFDYWMEADWRQHLTRVDAYPDTPSPFGVMDMIGNAGEFVEDPYLHLLIRARRRLPVTTKMQDLASYVGRGGFPITRKDVGFLDNIPHPAPFSWGLSDPRDPSGYKTSIAKNQIGFRVAYDTGPT